MEAGHDAERVDGIEIQVRLIRDPGTDLVIGDQDAFIRFDEETVGDITAVADQGGFIPVKKVIGTRLVHQRAENRGVKEDHDAGRAALRDTEPDGDGIPGIRLGRETEHRGFIAENRGKDKRINRHTMPPYFLLFYHETHGQTRRGAGRGQTENIAFSGRL